MDAGERNAQQRPSRLVRSDVHCNRSTHGMTYEHDSWIVSSPVFPQLAYSDVKHLSVPTEGDLVLRQWVAGAVAGSVERDYVKTVGGRRIQK